MRVLALAALDVSYIRDNWLAAIKDVLGDDALVVNATPLLACGPAGLHTTYVHRIVATTKVDWCFVYHDYVFSDYDDDFFGNLRSAGVKTTCFHPDDEPEVWYQRNRKFDSRYDVVASHSARGTARRISEGRPTRAVHVPWGFNPTFFDRPARPLAPEIDVVFVGKYKVEEHDSKAFREDGRHRDDALVRVAHWCARHGKVFRVFGHGWERHPRLAPFAGGLLSHADMLRVLHSSRIVLNPGWSADPSDTAPQTKLRHFEVPGAGAFQLTNTNPELAEAFTPDLEMGCFDDADHLEAQVARYLADDRLRKRIADAGYRRAHAEHTLQHRVRHLFFDICGGARRTPQSARRRAVPVSRGRRGGVMRIDVARAAQLPTVAAELPSRLAKERPTAVHIAAVKGTLQRADYALLADLWSTVDAPVLEVRSFYEGARRKRNPLQPMRHEIDGGLLSSRVALDAITPRHRSALRRALPGFEHAGLWHPLINYVARADAAVALLRAFVAKDGEALAALRPLPTGFVVPEFSIDIAPDAGDTSETAVPRFLAPLQAVLDIAARRGQRVAVYGARGDMADVAIDAVLRHPGVRCVGLVDRALAGTRIRGVRVVNAFDLPRLAPNYVIIAAAWSGPAIHEQLRPLEPRMTLVPLYDLRAPAWHVLLP
jgi:hypothetical protein